MQTLQLMAGLIGAAIGHQSAFEATQRLLDDLARSAEASRARDARTRAIIASANNAFVSTDDRGSITEWNQQAVATFGWSRAEAMGQPMAELIIPERFRAAHLEGMRRYVAGGAAIALNRRVELHGLRRDDGEFPVELTINSIRSGERIEFFAFLHDITGRRETEAKLLQMAHYDSLTGLPNRAWFNDRLDYVLNLSRRSGPAIALAYLDIDDFKAINDSYGHGIGDAVLQEFAGDRPRVCAQPIPWHAWGETNSCCCWDLSSAADVSAFTAKVLGYLREPALVLGRSPVFTASMGATFCQGEMPTAEALLARADHALYEAKRSGKNILRWG